ncbi:MAG: glycosyltransferase family 39 protein [Magnetococcales bacterium]|nr:glycosyltransferase family 39 protein [Magnetococcales bacterium]
MKTRHYAQLFLILLVSVLYTRDMFNENLFYPDAGHLMLDGVFIADYLKHIFTNGFTDPMEYAIRYFGQYPALSIGYKPPLWPAIQAVFILILGVAPWVMRLALLILALFAVITLYRTIERCLGPFVAWAAASVTISIPYLVQWGWYAMTELPALIFILSAGWPFIRYLEERKNRHLAYLVILLAAGAWCKQTAAVGAIWIIIAAIFSLGFKETFKRREIWAAMVAYSVLILPVIMLTLEFGKKNLAQSVGKGKDNYIDFVAPQNNLFKYINILFEDQLSTIFITLAIAGILVAMWRLYKGVKLGEKHIIILFLSLIIATYIFFTLLYGNNPRYTMFWLPAFGFFAGYLLSQLRSNFSPKYAAIAVSALLSLNVMQSFAMLPREVVGMPLAAEFVIQNSKSPIVMVDSYINAHFIYSMRQKDPEQQFWIIRADKVLSLAPMNPTTNNVTTLAHSIKDIKNILFKYGVRYVVVEKNELMGIPIHSTLRDYLTSSDFRLMQEIATSSNRDNRYNKGQAVQIFEFLKWKKPKSSSISIQVPIVGKTFTTPIRELNINK